MPDNFTRKGETPWIGKGLIDEPFESMIDNDTTVIWNAQSLEDKIYELWNLVFLIVNSFEF